MQSHFPDTYAFTPLNISRLRVSASEWKSDISPANLNNIQKRYTWQALPVVVTDVSTRIGAWMQIVQYEAWCVEFLKHLTDLSWIILSCFFCFFSPDYFRWHFCSAGQRQRGVTAETEQRERMTCNKGHKRRTCYICFNWDNRQSAELLLSKLCTWFNLCFCVSHICKPVSFSDLTLGSSAHRPQTRALPFTKMLNCV